LIHFYKSKQVTMVGLEDALQWLGTIFLIKLVCVFFLNLHAGFQAYVYPALCSHQSFCDRYGAWCLVTGCTQGIGKEYALGLAARGMDVVLVGRNKNRLADVRSEIESLHKVKTKVIVADLSDVNATQAVVDDVKRWGIDLGILVNNVGSAGEHMMPFLEQEEDTVRDMVVVNMIPCTLLTHAFLPAMREKRRGAIINISSVAVMQPMPYIAVYAATKHYVHAFTEALAYENRGSGVTFQEVSPGAVDTALTKYLPTSRFSSRAKPGTFVKSSLTTLGHSSTTCGWWPHSLQLQLLNTLPSMVREAVVRKALEYTEQQIRKNMRERRKES